MIKLKPMKMTDVSVTTADQYINDPAYVMEQKMDGARALISWSSPVDLEGTFTWQASGGGPLKFSAAVQHIDKIQAILRRLFNANEVWGIVLDGELMVEEGELRIFDMPYVSYLGDDENPTVQPDDSFEHRRAELIELFQYENDESGVFPVTQAMSSEAKRMMWERINAAGVEGAMVKRLDAPYESGVRTKSQLKLKLVKSADVIVTKVERRFDHKGMVTHGSAELAVIIQPSQDPRPYVSQVTGKRLKVSEYEELLNSTVKSKQARALAHEFKPRDLLPVGAASLIGKELTIDSKSIVEVNYLYWTGDALVQPRIVRERRVPEEKTHLECTLNQLPEYSRAAVA